MSSCRDRCNSHGFQVEKWEHPERAVTKNKLLIVYMVMHAMKLLLRKWLWCFLGQRWVCEGSGVEGEDFASLIPSAKQTPCDARKSSKSQRTISCFSCLEWILHNRVSREKKKKNQCCRTLRFWVDCVIHYGILLGCGIEYGMLYKSRTSPRWEVSCLFLVMCAKRNQKIMTTCLVRVSPNYAIP